MIIHIANILSFNATDTLWLWLFPVTYLIHFAEEYWGGGGFSAHLLKTKGFRLTSLRFFFMAGLGWLGMIALIAIAEMFKFPQLVLVMFGTVILANGLSHMASGVLKSKYNPGLVTAILLWIPQGAITLVRLSGSMSASRYLVGILIGVGLQVAASLLSLSGGKVKEAGGESVPLSVEPLQPMRDTMLLLIILCLNCYIFLERAGGIQS